MKLKIIILNLVVLLVVACNSGRIFHENHTFDNYSWNKTDTLCYNIDIREEEANADYFLEFDIRYIIGYQYKYMNISILVVCPDGNVYDKTESIQIRQDNSDYIGDGAGSYWDIQHTIKDKFKFKQEGKYVIKISPIVEDERMYFINELALSIVKQE